MKPGLATSRSSSAIHDQLGITGGLGHNSPAPAVVHGQNAVTNPITGTEQFYRLALLP